MNAATLCPGPSRTGPHTILMSFLAEQVAGILQVRKVAQFERNVVHGAVTGR